MRKKVLRTVVLLLVLVYALGHLLMDEHSNPDFDVTQDFLAVGEVDPSTALLLKGACYDCHSMETVYPWYAEVIPIRFIIDDHVEHGRSELNFSEWGIYPREDRRHIMKESIEYVENGEMPLKGYVLMHPEAKLNEAQKEELKTLFRNAMN
jgi:hypothetical protein